MSAFIPKGVLSTLSDPKLILVAGRLQCSVAGQSAYAEQNLLSGSVFWAYYKTAGTAGNSYTFCLKDDGLGKASLDMSTCGITTDSGTFDTVIQMATGGEAGNSWVLDILPHGIAGGGVVILEDATAKKVVVMYEATVSTIANFETAVGLCTYISVKTGGTGTRKLNSGHKFANAFAGGKPHCWAELVSTDVTLHYTHGTTVSGDLVTAFGALSGGTKFAVDCDSMTDALAAGDDSSASPNAFTMGVDASGTMELLSCTGTGSSALTVSRELDPGGYTYGKGTYRINLPWTPTALVASGCCVEDSGAPIDLCAAFSLNTYYQIWTYDRSGGYKKDHATAKVHFWALFQE